MTESEPVDSNHVSKESGIDSGHSTSCVKLKDIVKEHRSQVIPKTEIGKVLTLIYIAISNAGRQLMDIYKVISMSFVINSTGDISERTYSTVC